jgi:cell division cycle protein 20 (cofactor of APC complex)
MKKSRDRYVLDMTETWKHINTIPFSNVSENQMNMIKAKALGFQQLGLFPISSGQENDLRQRERIQDIKYRNSRLGEVPRTPVAILDCPDLRDDFYLNVLDWSMKNVVSIALDCSVYSYNYIKKSSECVATSVERSYVCALRSLKSGDLLSIANCSGCISILDFETNKELIRGSIPGDVRVATLASKDNGGMFSDHILVAGSKHGNIYGYDIRRGMKKSIFCLQEHALEVCGIEMAHNSWLFASGGNDNKVCIWDIRKEAPLFIQDDYDAAVKALSWCPWQSNLLATGAGTGDRRLRFWNTSTNSCLRHVETDSQICGVMWSPLVSEVITAHGYMDNDLALWKYPSLDKIVSIQAHETRILHSALSPDGTTVATTAANESLKFWELYRKRPLLRSPIRQGISLYQDKFTHSVM